MRLRFTKMQGAGNDFVVLDGIRQELQIDAQRARHLADRHFGVGADQVLVVERAFDGEADFRYRIFNADGGEVEQCGNGARCFVKFVHQQGLTRAHRVRVATKGGPLELILEDGGEVRVDMGRAGFGAAPVHFDASGLAARTTGGAQLWPVEIDGFEHVLCLVSMGNPHAVQFVDDVAAAPVAALGPRIERHPRFAQGVNAGFAQVLDRHRIRIRVWERGAGETLACGSGACAAAAAGMRMGLLESPVQVIANGGALRIDWSGADDAPVFMAGPAETVFEGEIEVP
jgi:diaminopimelate epimerase